ncbi:MAG: hypothetical protein ABIR62_17895 [Dokdonella sp.]|uniref:hypothetical protein n=1 Tax=Dokdonella sp. TaxID=2291710 RepID=UPI003267549B
MITPALAPESLRWVRWCIGLAATAVGALSVHAIMLQVFDVPFPDLSVIPGPFKLVVRIAAALALIIFWQRAASRVEGSFLKRWGLLFVIAAMLQESLLRGPFMEGYCTTAWVFAFVGNLQKLTSIAVVAALVVVAAPRLTRVWQKVVAAAVIATFGMFIATPLIGMAMAPVMASIASLAPQSEWCTLPYGPNVLIPAYLTFAEPVLACIAAAGLIWNRLSPSRALRFAQFTLLILAIKNQLLMPFIYAAFAKVPLVDAFVSESQFALEAVALALLAGVTWEWTRPKARQPAMGPVD